MDTEIEARILSRLFHDDEEAQLMAQGLVEDGLDLLDAIALVQTRQAISAQRAMGKTLTEIRNHLNRIAHKRT